MSDSPTAVSRGTDAARDLEAPLPAEIAGRNQGRLTCYRRYPVFSRAWARGRMRSVGMVALVSTLLGLGGAALTAEEPRPWGAMLQVLMSVALPIFVGPWLGSLIRHRRLAPRREMAALAALMLGLVLIVIVFHHWGAEPLKQRLAQWTGDVDEQGRRKRVALMIGITIRPAPGDAAATPPTSHDDTGATGVRAASTMSIALLTFALAGGFALPRLAREREGLATLAREQELARAQAARHEAQMRLSVLAAQVEPHFLFNTLASVRSAIATDPARASELVDHLADYLRASIPRLRSDGSADATLGGQVEIVRAYLALMAARMPRLSYGIDVPEALLGTPFPPLMLISLAENAVKHGVEPRVGPVHIEVRAATLADGRLQVSVVDDGAGFGTGGIGSGLGLANIRERLAQMHGDRAELVLRARDGGGVQASLVVPGQ